MRPLQSRWLIRPGICLLLSGWTVFGRQARTSRSGRHERPRLQRPTAEIEDNINRGRTAFVTASIAALRGGMPIRVGGEVVGAVGIAGLSKETDVDIANTAAASLGSLSETAGHH